MITSLWYEDLLFNTILESSPSHGFRHDRDHIRIASCIHCDFIDLVGEIPDALHGLPEDLISHNDMVLTLDSLSEEFSLGQTGCLRLGFYIAVFFAVHPETLFYISSHHYYLVSFLDLTRVVLYLIGFSRGSGGCHQVRIPPGRSRNAVLVPTQQTPMRQFSSFDFIAVAARLNTFSA